VDKTPKTEDPKASPTPTLIPDEAKAQKANLRIDLNNAIQEVADGYFILGLANILKNFDYDTYVCKTIGELNKTGDAKGKTLAFLKKANGKTT